MDFHIPHWKSFEYNFFVQITFTRLTLLLCCLGLFFVGSGCCSSGIETGEEIEQGGDGTEGGVEEGTLSAGSDEFDDPSFSQGRWSFGGVEGVDYTVSGGALTIDLDGVAPPEDGGPSFYLGKVVLGDCDVEVFVSSSNHDEEGENVLFAIAPGSGFGNPPAGALRFGKLLPGGGAAGYGVWDQEEGALSFTPYASPSIYFRMQRSGTQLTSLVSEDGSNWTTLSPVQEASTDQEEALVGITLNSGQADNNYQVSINYVRFRCGGVATEGDPLLLIPCGE